MNISNVYPLFFRHRNLVKNLQKTCIANSYLSKSKGTRKMEKARKYKRPEDLEDPYYYGVGPRPKVKQAFESLSTRGFGKELPSYIPPENVEDQLQKLCKKVFGPQLITEWKSQSLEDKLLKFKLLTKSMDLFKKDMPSSLLHKMNDVNDVLEYFNTPVDGAYHYDALVRDSETLPPNLQVLPDTPRFNPIEDTFFDGITAFPGRRRTVFTKTREKFEKVIEWPNL